VTSNEYRERAERLLAAQVYRDQWPGIVAEAAVWAQLALAAALTETADQNAEVK
jgi:hypothetical protein